MLCSVLLGFGLDAWVCVGTRRSGSPHTWVMTRGPYSAVTFWETTTGEVTRQFLYLFILFAHRVKLTLFEGGLIPS